MKLLQKLRHWIVYRLGGVILSKDEEVALIPIRIEKWNKSVQEQINQQCMNLLINQVRTTYTPPLNL
jgi:hypothetical protein